MLTGPSNEAGPSPRWCCAELAIPHPPSIPYRYPIYGSLQSWLYKCNGIPGITLELSHTKRPDSDQLDDFWHKNKDGFLYLMELAWLGIDGHITSRDG